MPRSFFIDFNAVNDSANGTTKSTPWKRCPGMVGFGGTYAHQTGDHFYFKGGVTWTGTFTFNIANSGSLSTPDYYGVDATWYAGSAWTKPQFDQENTTGSAGMGILVTGINIVVDNIEFYRYKAGNGATAIWAQVFIQNNDPNYSPPLVKFTNCHWRATNQNENLTGARCIYKDGNSHVETDFCEFEQSDLVHHNDVTGNGILDTVPNVVCSNADVVSHCWFHHTVNALLGNGEWHHSEFGPMNHAYSEDGDVHGNAMEPFANTDGYNNYIHDLAPTVEAILTDPATTNPNIHFFFNFFNNLIDSGNGKGISFDFRRAPHNTVTSRACNNTVVNASIGMADPSFMLLTDLRNNHVINGGIQSGSSNTTTVVSNNLIQTTSQATAAGYTAANRFQPTSGSAPTVLGAPGVNISSLFGNDLLDRARPSGGGWNIGAYEFSGVSNQAPNGIITLPTQNVTITQGGAVNFTSSASDPDGNLPLSYAWDFGSSNVGTSNVQNPGTKTFPDVGVFTVTLTVRDSLGLADSTPDTRTITVNAISTNPVLSVTPSFNFGFVDPGVVSNGVLVVTNTGTGTLVGTASTSAPFSITSGANYSLAANQSQSVFIRYQQAVTGSIDSGLVTFTGGAGDTSSVTGRTPFGLTFNANQGVITAPFNVQLDSSVAQAVETTTPSAGGLDYFEFIAPSAGDYTITASVNAPGTGNNSFFINVDAEPTSAMIWDINPITSGFEVRNVVWRGGGSADGPAEFDPKTFTLSQGKHKLYLRGRETNTKIALITAVSATAQVNQAPTAMLTSDVISGVGPLLVTFTLGSLDSDGTIASGVLDYGDGSGTLTISSPASSIIRTHTYGAVGVETIYSATWTATDNGGATGAATRNVTISATPPPAPNQPPNASFTAAPLSGNSPLPVDFVFSSSDSDGIIASAVIDYGDGSATETITTPASSVSRSHTYSNAGPGSVTRVATWVVTDDDGAVTNAPTKSISVSAPVVAAISVTPSSLSFGSVSIGQTKALPLVVKNVGGLTLSGTATPSGAPFTGSAAYSLAPGTTQTLFVVYTPSSYSASDSGSATFTGGGGASVALAGTSPANVAPSCTLNSPIDGAIFTVSVANPINLVVGASASDSDGTITKVEFYDGSTKVGEDTTSPYTLDAHYTAPGVHVISAKATDSGGASTTSNSATLTLVAPVVVQPTVSIDSPAQGDSFSFGSPIQISVTSSAVVKVEYYSDAMKIGQDTQAPHNFTWTNAPVGGHTLTVVVTDNLGNTKTSNPVGIVVLATPPSNAPVPFIIYVNPA